MKEPQTAVNYYSDLKSIDEALEACNKTANPVEWARLMNNKGLILISLDKFSDAEATFIAAFPQADSPLKCKILLNSAKNNLLANNTENALKQLNKIAPLAKECPRRQATLFTGYTRLIKGEALYRAKNDKLALAEFKMAEYSFEGEADLSGVGISCMEIARVHINNKNLTIAWPFLKKSESCLAKFGPDESLGVVVCRAVALYYDGKEEEAEALLKKAYMGIDEFGFARYMVSEMLDAYLYIRLKSVRFQKNFL